MHASHLQEGWAGGEAAEELAIGTSRLALFLMSPRVAIAAWQPCNAAWRLLPLLVLASLLSAALALPIKTVTDLRAAIYTKLPLGGGQAGDACVRLLHAVGEVGCAASTGRLPTEGRLLRLDALRQPEEYPDGAAFLVPPALLDGFLLQCRDSPSLASRVKGVLLEPGPAPAYSQAAAAPLQEFALYADRSYAWNPTGQGLNGLAVPFPVFLLDNATAQSAQQRAAYNLEQHMNGALNYARMQLTMEASGNSTACLRAGTCLPLGGHSVLAALPALPPLNASSSGSSNGSSSGGDLPAIWVLAQFDTAALFHEAMVGAEAPLSGLIAMLAAVEVLGSADASSAAGRYRERYRRRLVFVALAGEPWGLMGSKRLLWQAASNASSVGGLDVSAQGVAAVLEVSQVGRANWQQQPGGGSSDSLQFFAHTPAGGAALAAGLLAALQTAAGNSSGAAGLGATVTVAPASSSLPGLPPTASAGSFLRVLNGRNSPLPALVLGDFDETFRGSTFQSHGDGSEGVDASSIAAAAVVLARAAHVLALGEGAAAGEPLLPVNLTGVRATVDGLMQCLLNSSVGLSCPLAQGLLSPVSPQGHVSHYVGILRTLTADPQTPDAGVKKDVERFLWNFLAFALRPKDSAAGAAVASSSTDGAAGGGAGGGGGGVLGGDLSELQRCKPLNATGCPPGFVCAGSRSMKGLEGEGYCLNSTVLYMPSYSTSLLCDGCDAGSPFSWKLTDAAAQWEQQHGWPPDPAWAESNWPNSSPSLTLFLKEDPATENALLAVGLVVAAASVAGVVLIRMAYHRKLKRQ